MIVFESSAFLYQGYPWQPNSCCHVTVHEHRGQTIATATQLADCKGASITNAAHNLNAALKNAFGDDVFHIEHYHAESYSPPIPDYQESWALVTVRDGCPRWRSVSRPIWLSLIGEVGR